MRPVVGIFSKDPQFYLMLSHILEADGFITAPVASLQDAVEWAGSISDGALVLDCRKGQRTVETVAALLEDPIASSLPIVALLAAGTEDEQFELIKIGVKEQFVSPFVPRKLLEYLRSILKKPMQVSEDSAPAILTFGDVKMDRLTHRVHFGGHEVLLGPIDYNVMNRLIEFPQRVFSRDELISSSWPRGSTVDRRTVDVHIGQLRRLLQLNSKTVSIRTVRLAGYALKGIQVAK